MQKNGLLFIPDISGFTRFINQSEIEHSKHIIEELLDTIINANQLGLEISEIEGDAILFYKFGTLPSLNEIEDQVKKMFIEFHKKIKNYETRRICQCGACRQTVDLTLKFISHSGEFTGYQVKDFYKLLGKDVILAHQLLKNDIETHEYWLVTNDLFSDTNSTILNWQKGEKQTDETIIPFYFTMLTALKDSITEEQVTDLTFHKNKAKVISVSKDIKENIAPLFAIVSDLSLRSIWMNGVKKIDSVAHKINQVGNKHRCILEKEVNNVYTTGFTSTNDKIILSESDEKKTFSNSYILEKIDEDTTRITLELFLKINPILLFLFNLFMKKKMTNKFLSSVNHLTEYTVQNKSIPLS